MPAWLIRGLALAAIHAAAYVALAKIAVFRANDRTVVNAVVFALLIGAALSWSAIDGWLRREERGKTWLITALLAGPSAGLLTVIGKSLFVDQTGVSELGIALTSSAAFTALLILVPAGLGLFVGGWLDRSSRSLEVTANRSRHGKPGQSGSPQDVAPDKVAGRPAGKRSTRRSWPSSAERARIRPHRDR